MKCHGCNKAHDKLMKCSVCQDAWYCSVDCQKEHYPSHKSVCTSSACLKLFEAIRTDDTSTVERLAKTKRVLNGRADYTPPSTSGDTDASTSSTVGKWTALHQCVREAKPDLMKILIENGANLEVRDVDGDTPTFLASTCGANPHMIQILLTAGANPNAQSQDGWSCLMMAARDASYDIVKALLEAGADLDAGRDMFGRTALDISEMQATGQGIRVSQGESYENAMERSRRVNTLLKECAAARGT